jgi:hypothetical protein
VTDKQAIYIKTFLEGAFPMLKESKESDLTYVVMLKEYDFETMFQATKNYIKKSVYVPTIAGLIKEYENVIEQNKRLAQQELLNIADRMEETGFFKTNEDFRKLSEYEEACLMIQENNITEDLKNKILKFTKNDKNVKLMLETLSGKEKECSSLFLNAGIVAE